MPAWFLAPYILFLAAFPMFLIAVYRSGRKKVLLLKMACSLCFILVGALGFALGKLQSPPIYDMLMITAFCLSLLGDLALAWKDNQHTFLLGLVAFLIAQVCFGVTFSFYNHFATLDILVFAVLFIGPILAYLFLHLDVGDLKIPVLVYLLVIAFMFTKALSSLYLKGISLPAQWLVAVGAGLFYFSDAILALNKFQRQPSKYLRTINLITYYAGQMLLASSLYFF